MDFFETIDAEIAALSEPASEEQPPSEEQVPAEKTAEELAAEEAAAEAAKAEEQAEKDRLEKLKRVAIKRAQQADSRNKLTTDNARLTAENATLREQLESFNKRMKAIEDFEANPEVYLENHSDPTAFLQRLQKIVLASPQDKELKKRLDALEAKQPAETLTSDQVDAKVKEATSRAAYQAALSAFVEEAVSGNYPLLEDLPSETQEQYAINAAAHFKDNGVAFDFAYLAAAIEEVLRGEHEKRQAKLGKAAPKPEQKEVGKSVSPKDAGENKSAASTPSDEDFDSQATEYMARILRGED